MFVAVLPIHIFCGGRTTEEDGYGQKVICRDCVATQGHRSQHPTTTVVRLPDLRLRDPYSAKDPKAHPYLAHLSAEGEYRRVYFTCLNCSNNTASVKFRAYRKWDVYGYCTACHAKYKKTDCKTNSRTHQTTLCFQMTTDESFNIPEITSGLSSDPDIHPHFRYPIGKPQKIRGRISGRTPERERLPSQGDPYDSRFPDYLRY